MLSVAEVETPTMAGSVADTITLEPWAIGSPDGSSEISQWQEPLRRYLNVAIALVGLILLSPVMVLIAIAIKLSSPGPVLFKQVRVGLDRRSPANRSLNWRRKVDYGGRLFTLYKFRTMYHDRGDEEQVWAKKDDPRVFPLGKFLRKYRLDEIPQLLNVVRGDMNIVGPRPEQPAIFMALRSEVTRYPLRQRVLPGITGLAQINQHYDMCIEDVRRKVAFDLEYIRRKSAVEDLRIMLQTLPSVVLKSTGW